MDPGLNSLLQWSIENSEASRQSNGNTESAPSTRGLNAEALKTLLGGPSDADLMREAMVVIENDEATHEAKMTAFDNFEQLVENLDNANNMESLGLWTPLVEQLQSDNADLRRMAAWCIGTAVQNNEKAQERLLVLGGVPKLVGIALNDADQLVRKKSIYALSSAIRNYQPATSEALKHLPDDKKPSEGLLASDMDAIDSLMAKLRG
ncbi:MAG: hypothetical protein Q9160_002439 [Pyrenula sp. 1 TL-2023]